MHAPGRDGGTITVPGGRTVTLGLDGGRSGGRTVILGRDGGRNGGRTVIPGRDGGCIGGRDGGVGVGRDGGCTGGCVGGIDAIGGTGVGRCPDPGGIGSGPVTGGCIEAGCEDCPDAVDCPDDERDSPFCWR